MKTSEIKKAIPECRKAWNEEKHKVSSGLQNAIDVLFKCTEALCDKVDKLEKKINKNSANSSKPPSTDEYPIKKSPNRKTGTSKRGRPKGHSGSNLKFNLNPHEIIPHILKGVCLCGHDLESSQNKKIRKRQVWDIRFNSHIEEHNIEILNCPCCSKKHIADHPKHVNAPIQYGPKTKSLVNYLIGYQLLPFKRTQDIFEDLFNLPLSQSSAFNFIESGFQELNEFENKIKDALLNSKINHADETSIKINKDRHHLHVLSNESYTLLSHHKNRGMKAVKEIGILKSYKGILVHDCFSMYFNYGKLNAICNAHLLRELLFVDEIIGQKWANQMRIFLFDLNELVKDHKNNGEKFIKYDNLEKLEKEFSKLLFTAKLETHSLINEGGQGMQDPAYNLYKRLRKRRDDILRFMYDFDVPFTNNLAERDLRMTKVKLKISGCFRTIEGAKKFARLKSFISTLKKQRKSILNGISDIFTEKSNILDELFHPST